MVVTQHRSKRKASGGRYKAYRKKRLYERGRVAAMTGLGETKKRQLRTRGAGIKIRLLRTTIANTFDPKTKKYTQAKIKTIVQTPANVHYARRNIMTKGTIIETELGKARVTSRPGQDGAVNAVLI